MNQIIITIKTTNSAFDPDLTFELSRILKEIADNLDQGYNPENINILDINGNIIGDIQTK